MSSEPLDQSETPSITRRDLVSGAVAGAGAIVAGGVVLGGATSGAAQVGRPGMGDAVKGELTRAWTGPGGIGDYAGANGNTHGTVNAAHALRDGQYDLKNLPPVDEAYDLVVVGGGIAGLCAAYEYLKARPTDRVLIMDNNNVFGGEAKQNEVEVDGYRLQGPQGSNMCIWPATAAEKTNFFWHKAWRELGMPMGPGEGAPTWVDAPGMPLPKNHYSAMMVLRDKWPQSHFYADPANPGQFKRTANPWRNGYKDLPFSDKAKQELVEVHAFRLKKPDGIADIDAWLDTMTYKDYLTKIVGVTQQEVFDYLSPEIASYGTGMGCETVSALAAREYIAPGTVTQEEEDAIDRRRENPDTLFEPVTFPGGNATIARYFVKNMIPAAIAGGKNLKDVTYGAVQWDALDRPGQPLRLRCQATALDIRHDGAPGAAKTVTVTYVQNKDARKRRVRAKAVVMATGAWVNKHITRDAPRELLDAMDQFNHAPMLIVNVALRNWRPIHAMGTPALRWFDGLAWFTNVRAPMALDGSHMPVDPDKPAMLTFYVPYSGFAKVQFDGEPVRSHCIQARSELFALTFEDIETRMRDQLQKTFGAAGFDHKRDIAAIITNRWGHAYVVPQVGFFFGEGGKKPAKDVVAAGYGRVRFGHSEVSGVQVWHHACDQGERAAKQVLAMA